MDAADLAASRASKADPDGAACIERGDDTAGVLTGAVCEPVQGGRYRLYVCGLMPLAWIMAFSHGATIMAPRIGFSFMPRASANRFRGLVRGIRLRRIVP